MMADPQQSTAACFIFTREMLQLTQKALRSFKRAFQRGGYQGKKADFAAQTMQRIGEKLDVLQQADDEQLLTTFDANEKVILAAVMQLCMLDLLSTPTHARRDLKLKHCQQILQFAQSDLPMPKQAQK